MAQETYTPFDWFWFGLVPAVLLGAAIYTLDSGGFLGHQLQEVIGHLARFLAETL